MEKEKELHNLTLKQAANELLQTNLPSFLSTINQFIKLSNLKSFATIIIDKYEEKDYLFANSTSLLNDTLPTDIKEQLKELETQLTSKNSSMENRKHYVSLLQSLIELLTSASSKNTLIAASNSPKKNSIREIFSEEIRILSFNLPINDIDSCLPNKLKASHYTSYMRFIHRLCGTLMIQSQADKPKMAGKTQNVYVEKVPIEVERNQLKMNGCDAVPDPDSFIIEEQNNEEKTEINEEIQMKEEKISDQIDGFMDELENSLLSSDLVKNNVFESNSIESFSVDSIRPNSIIPNIVPDDIVNNEISDSDDDESDEEQEEEYNDKEQEEEEEFVEIKIIIGKFIENSVTLENLSNVTFGEIIEPIEDVNKNFDFSCLLTSAM